MCKTFTGLVRRLDRKTDRSSVLVYEGFGSSYEKARAAIDAIKLHFPAKRLLIVFEPHTFSWRNRDTIRWYDSAFAGAQSVLVYEPAQQGAQTHKQLTLKEIVEQIRKSGIDATPVTNEKEALAILTKELHADDVVLLMTSGDIGGLIESIPKLVERQFPK